MTERSDLTIHQFRVFDTVVSSGSLTQAALRLAVPQPSISRIIGRLEREIGTPLLNRSSAGITLTAAGDHFHRNALNAIYYHDMALEEARASEGLLVGDVRIAAPDSVAGILFAPLVQNFKKCHKNAWLRTIASQSVEIPSMLASYSIDIGIAADTHTLPSGMREPLFSEELYLVGPKSAPVMENNEVSLSEIGDIPLVLNAMPGGFRSLIDKGFAELGIVPRIEIEIDANNALLDLLVEGAGFSILPYSLIASAHNRIPLGAVRLVNPTLTRTLFILTAPNKPMRLVVREAIRQVRQISKKKSSQARWQLI